MDELVEYLIANKALANPTLVTAFRAVDRADFVLDIYRGDAYLDQPLRIGHGQTISQPSTVATMLEWLEVRPGDHVLDIGAGSGWQAALLAHVVGAGGSVRAIEVIPELCRFARSNLKKYPSLYERITFHCGTACEGVPEGAPYTRIIAAATVNSIPSAWLEQLAPNGRLVVPVGESIEVIAKSSDGSFKRSVHEGYLFVPFV